MVRSGRACSRTNVERFLGLLVLGMTSGLGTAHAASPAGANAPAYDVVTIKPSQATGRVVEDQDADSFWARGVTLKALIAEAYGVRRELVSGVPAGLQSMRFDLLAKVVDPDAIAHLNDEQRPEMLRLVLEDRFRLKVHVVTRVMPVYELVVSRGGPKFQPTPRDGSTVPDIESYWTRLKGIDATMGLLADALSSQTDRNVLDKTGLTGHYEFILRWSRDAEEASDVMLPPGLFAALQDELGLKLVPAKGPVKTLVVDAAEVPGEN